MNLNMLIISDLCIGSLKDLMRIKKKFQEGWSEQELISLLKEASEGLAHLEANNIAHRNVKPSNILIGDDKLTYKVVDFKSSIIMENRKKMVKSNIVGTPRYMSPELKQLYQELKSKNSARTSLTYDPYLSDVFSLGIVILELM